MGFQIVLLYVSEFSKCFTVREWVSSVFYRTCVSFPRALPYVSEFPLCLTVTVFQVFYRTWLSFPYALLYVCEFPPVPYRTWVSFSSVLPYMYVTKFPLCFTAR